MRNGTSLLEKEWKEFINYFEDPKQALVQIEEKNGKQKVVSLELPKLNLIFEEKNGKLFCKEFEGYYLATPQRNEKIDSLFSSFKGGAFTRK